MNSQPSFLGFHYDIARGTYLTTEMFHRALRLAADSGYTHFLPYLENMIRLPSMAKACPRSAYTADDWRAFEATARKAGIELVPHFNVIGHTENICPFYPELTGSTDGPLKDIDPALPIAREWTLRCLGEFCEFSRSRYFLIGGDEWQPSPHLLARPGFDVARAWSDQVNACVEFLAQRGRTPIVWHDMLIHHTPALESLSRKAVIAFWFYDTDSDYAALDLFKKHGFETIMATAVFGGGTPTMGHRCLAALRRAREAAQKHRCAGTLVTSWESCRWEYESFNIPAAAKVLRGEEPSPAIVTALSRFQAWQKVPRQSSVAQRWKAEIEKLASDPGWDTATDLRRVLLATVRGDTKDNVASYERFHSREGHGFEAVARPSPVPTWPSAPTQFDAKAKSPFGLTVTTDPRAGDALRFASGNGFFDVYPRYGTTLQNWCEDGEPIIPPSMDSFLKRNALPGGYRSFNAAGGFRPIWALGTHSNPCILWQHPWSWKVIEQNDQRVSVQCALSLPHGDFAVRIGIERGLRGFTYEARCTNKLAYAHGGFNFNLLLPLHEADLDGLTLSWTEDARPRSTTVASRGESAFWIPARGPLTARYRHRTIHIDAPAAETAGYFVDWGPGMITPDLHGVYRPRAVGEETVVRWRFALA